MSVPQPRTPAYKPKRKANGQLEKGNSGNPSGRPKSKGLSVAYQRILDEEGADMLAHVIYTDAIRAKHASERLAATKELTDRTEGKARQSIHVTGELDAGTVTRLTELAELLR